MEHGDLDALIDRTSQESPVDELMMRRLKKRRLALRDQIARLELAIDPKEPA
ncbi:MAG: YdcH family protein [Pseudomonadota bacterium]